MTRLNLRQALSRSPDRPTASTPTGAAAGAAIPAAHAPVVSRPQLLVGFLLLLSLLGAASWGVTRQISADRWVRHTMAVEVRVDSLWANLLYRRANERAFLLTGSAAYSRLGQQARDNAVADFDRLAALSAENPRQKPLLQKLRPIVVAPTIAAEGGVNPSTAARELSPRALADFDRGAADMSQARALTARMLQEEERLLAERESSERRAVVVTEILLGGLGLALAALAWVILDSLGRQLGALRASEGRLLETNQRLEAEAGARERAETQMRQMQKLEAVGQLTGGIAHDFNNMLAIVMGSLELAKRRLASDQRKAEACIEAAMDGAGRAAQLTSRLLAFSRRQALEPQILDVNRFVGRMSEMLQRTLGEHVMVETVLAAGLWRVYADPGQLESAIVNLAVNARDAMPSGGRLTIESANAHLDDAYASAVEGVAPGQYVMVAITDTGVGVPADVLDKVFEPFFTTKGVGSGTGLGLSQVYGFIRQSKGHVRIYSEPGRGTTVKLYLPRRVGAEAGAAPEKAEPTLSRARGGETILVVEDDDSVRGISIENLEELGYAVLAATHADEALATMARQPRIDLLFTDVVMPGMNGRQLADEARRRWPQVKVLFTTGYTQNAIIHNGALDADAPLLAKPFTLEQLARKVRQLLDSEPPLDRPQVGAVEHDEDLASR
ncbi:MAG TPA: ATP-binding protein [Caulobacteraceae bacterium]|nr:ATP-binding protein [Caulobacteraceae bacterium]